MQRRGGECTVTLKMGKIAPNCGDETEDFGIVRNEDGHAMSMEAGGEVHEAVAKNANLGTGKERNVDGFQFLTRHWFVR